MLRYRVWIHSKDANGRPLDETILKAAEEKILTLTRYREKETGCESTINSLLQAVVEAASKANRRKAIRNPAAYLVSAYKHVVDKLLDPDPSIPVVVASPELAPIARGASREDEIHRRLVPEKILNAMDPETRQIADWKSAGYSMNDIGRALSMRPRRVYFRYRRGVQKAMKKVFGSPGNPPSPGRGGPE